MEGRNCESLEAKCGYRCEVTKGSWSRSIQNCRAFVAVISGHHHDTLQPLSLRLLLLPPSICAVGRMAASILPRGVTARVSVDRTRDVLVIVRGCQSDKRRL